MSPMELDAALRRLEEQDTTMDAEAAMIAGIENRRRAGSYAELDRCLASLARQSPRGFFLVWQVHIGRQVSAEHLTPIAAAQLERSVGYLLALMPNKIRVPKHLGGTGDGRPRSRSAEAIRLHFDEGLTVPEIVRRTGLSRSRIYEVLAEAAARRVRATNGEAA